MYKAVYDPPPTITFKGYAFHCIYRGEHIYDNHLVLKFIPTIKTNKCLYTYD